jgi:PIF1-like helicase/Helicase
MDKLKDIDIDDFILDDIDFETGASISATTSDLIIQSNQEGYSLAQEEAELIIPRCEFLTGGAGTGKTYEINRRMEEYKQQHQTIERQYGILAATTGIAAINLGGNTTTINSCLKYFDTDSLEENYTSGKLQQSLKAIARLADNLIIDEISMMHAKQLDIIWDALVEINQQMEIREMGGLGLIITGDFCQLPPVPNKSPLTGKPEEVKYAFEAQCWSYFEKNTTKLIKNWRQGDEEFIKALGYARRGDGMNCAMVLRAHLGVTFNAEIETNFDGTTIFSKNVEVDRLNTTRLRNLLHGGKRLFQVKSFRWGQQRSEWKNIPEQLELCESCYVMILANDSKQNGFRYANGTTGYVVSYESLVNEIDINKRLQEVGAEDSDLDGLVIDPDIPNEETDIPMDFVIPRTPNTFLIKLKKVTKYVDPNHKEGCDCSECNPSLEVEIGKICRQVLEKKHPDGQTEKPTFESLTEWKDNNKDKFRTAKEAKYLYESGYLVGKTREGMKSSHQFVNGVCTCFWRPNTTIIPPSTMINGIEQFEGHKRKASPEVYFDYNENKWVTGEIYYFPLRIAYASTCHKSQGLTLDRVQVDFINQFFGSPSMAYVALSRVRTAEGLRLVGSPKLLEERVNVSRKVMRFI